MARTVEEVVRNFGEGKLNKAGVIEWFDSHRTVTCDERTLQHGRSLRAVHLGEKLFLKNGDQMGGGWNQPLIDRYVRRHLSGPDVSFSALRVALNWFGNQRDEDLPVAIDDLTAANLVDWTSDEREPVVYLNSETHEYFERIADVDGTNERLVAWEKPDQGMFVPLAHPSSDTPAGTVQGYWHVLGGVVLRIGDKFLLGGLDENRYFLSLLANPVRSVAEGYRTLMPIRVMEAEAAGREVRRQGEWFFVKSSIDRKGAMALANISRVKEFEAAIRLSPLVGVSRQDGNQHVCHHIGVHLEEEYPGSETWPLRRLATGLVRHQRLNLWTGARRQTGEHSPVDLADAWWEVYENTAVRSWSTGGRFD